MPIFIAKIEKNSKKICFFQKKDQLATLAGCLDFDTYDQTINKVGAYTYTLTIKEQGLDGYNIKVQGTGNVVVKRKPLSAEDVVWTNPVADLTFSGSEQTPDIAASTTIYGEDYTLTEGVDYEVTYGGKINAGTYYATFTGKGNFGGTKQIQYKINPKPIAPTIMVGELTFANAVLECK